MGPDIDSLVDAPRRPGSLPAEALAAGCVRGVALGLGVVASAGSFPDAARRAGWTGVPGHVTISHCELSSIRHHTFSCSGTFTADDGMPTRASVRLDGDSTRSYTVGEILRVGYDGRGTVSPTGVVPFAGAAAKAMIFGVGVGGIGLGLLGLLVTVPGGTVPGGKRGRLGAPVAVLGAIAVLSVLGIAAGLVFAIIALF